MKDGAEKRQKQRELEYQKELDDYRNQIAKLAEDKKVEVKTDVTVDSAENRSLLALLGFDHKQVDKFYELMQNKRKEYNNDINTINKEQLDKEKEDWNNYLIEYGTYEEKKKAIAEKYAKLIVDAQTEGEKAKLKADRDKEQKELEQDYIKSTTAIGKLFGDMRKRSSKEIRAIAEQANLMIEFIQSGEWDSDKAEQFGIKSKDIFEKLNKEWSNSPKTLRAIRGEIEKLLKSAYETSNAFEGIGIAIEILSQKDISQSELETGLGLLSDKIGQITQMSKMLSNILSNLGSDLGKDLEATIDVIDQTISGAMAGGQAGGWIGAIVGAVLGLGSALSGIFKDNKAIIAEWEENVANLAKSYKQSIEDIARANRYIDFESVFGTDNWGQFRQAVKDYEEAIKSLREQFIKLGQDQQDAKDKFSQIGGSDGLINPRGLVSAIKEWQSLINQADGIEADIVAKRKSASDIHTYVQFNPNEFFNSDGAFKDGGLEGLRKWYNTYSEYLTKAEKDTLEKIIETGEDASAAIEIMNKYMASLFGDLSMNIAENLISAFEETGDAMSGLEDVAKNVARNMAIQLLNTHILEKYIEPYKKAIMDALNTGDQVEANRIIQEMMGSINDPNSGVGQFVNSLSEWFGLEAGKIDRQSAAQGFSQMSQDTGNALLGIAINMENNLHIIRKYLEENGVKNATQEATNVVLNNIYTQVLAIKGNTDRLENIENYMRSTMGNTLDSLNELRKFNR
jgi:hypothetical protein